MLEATVKRRRRQVCVILYNLAYLNSSDEHVSSRLRRLTPDERLLYHHIDQVQADGIWSKALRAKTNVTQQTLTKCLKSLECLQMSSMQAYGQNGDANGHASIT